MVNSISRRYTASARDSFILCAVFRRGSEGLLPVWFLLALTGFCCAVFFFLPWSPNTLHIVFIAVAAATGVVCAILHEVLTRLGMRAGLSQPHAPDRRHEAYRIPNAHNDAHPRAPLSEFEGDGRVSSPCLSSLRHVLPAVELIGLGMLMLFSSRVMPSGMSENNVIVSTGQGNCEFPSIVAWKVVVLHLWFLFAMNIPLLIDLCVGIVHYSVLIAQYQCVSIVTFIIAAQWVVVPMLCFVILFVRRGCFRVSCPHGNGDGAGDAFQNDFLSPKGADKQRLNRPQTFETQLTPAVAMDLQCHDSSEDIPCLVLSNGGTIVAEVTHHFATLVGLSPSDVAGCRLAALLDDLRVEKPERFLRIISAIARGEPDELDSDSEDDKDSQVCDDSHVLSPFAVRVALPSDEDAGDYSTVLGRRPSPARMGGIARRLFFRGHAVPASPPLPNAWPSHNNGPPTWPFCVTLDAWSRLDGLVVLRQPRLHAVLDRMQWPAVLVHPRSGRVLYWSPAAAQLTGNCATDVTGWPMRVSAKDGTQCGKVALEAWMHLPGAAASRLISIEPLMGEFVEEESAALERSVACLTWPPRHFLWNNQNNKNRRLPNGGGSGNDACGGRSIGGENSGNVREIDSEAHDRERSPRELPLPANCAPMSANSPDAFGVKGHREAQWYFAPIAHGRGDAHAWATGGVPLLCMLREETAPITQLSDHLSHPSCTNQQEQEERFAHALDDVTRECRAALRAALDHGGSKEELNEITERAERAVMVLECYQRGRREKHMDSSGEEDGAQTKRPAGPGLTPTTQSAKTSQHNSSRPSPLVGGTVQRNQTNAREQKKAHSSAGAAGAGTAVAVKDEDDDPKEDNPKGSRDSAVERSEARDKSKSQKSVLVQQNHPPLSRMRSRVRARGGGLSKRSPRMGRSSSSQKTFAPRLVSPLLVEKPISETAARTATAEVELVDATDIGGHPPQKFLQLSSTVATPSLVHSTAASELIPSPTNINIIVPSNNNNNNNNDKNNNINNNDVNNRNDDEEPAWAMLRSSDEATIASCYIRVRPGEVFYFGRSSKCHATTTDALVSSIQFAIVRQKRQLQQHQRALTSNDMSALSTSCDPQRNGPVGGWTITLHDHSANGTFVNVKKVGKGKSSVLRDHDLVTFRLSSSRFFLGFHFILLDERGLPVRDIASPTLSQLGSGLMSRRGTPHTNHNHHPQQQHHGTYHNSSMENGSFVGSSRVSGTPIYKNHNGSSRRPGTTPSRSSRVGGSAPHHRETIEWKIGEEMLGKGGNAEVYLGINLTNGKLIAVKRVLLPTCGEGESNRAVLQQYRSLQEEINVLSKAVHPNIVQYYGSSQNQTYFNILLEFVPGGSLRHLLDNFGGLSAGVIFLYLRQTLEGLRYLHQHNIVHSDVKAANILITDKGRVKLSDFGTAKLLGHRQHSQSVDRSGKPAAVSAPATSAGGELGAGSHCTYRVAGTLRWMAPELIRDESSVGPTRASDIWSVGCTLVEMLSSNAPWWEYDFESEEQIINLLKYTTEPPEIPECEECPDLYDIAARCLTLDPATRPSCEELLQMVIDAAECFQARESLPPSTLREGSAAVPRIATSVDASPIQKQQEEQQQ